jgi:hypothetical protein
MILYIIIAIVSIAVVIVYTTKEEKESPKHGKKSLYSYGSWDPKFTDASVTLTGVTYTGNYNIVGKIVFFCVNVQFTGYVALPSTLGTGQYQITLPYAARQTFTSRGGTLHNPATDSKYHIAGITDTAESTTIMKFYYSGGTTDLAWKFSTPVSWANVLTHFDISGFYEMQSI